MTKAYKAEALLEVLTKPGNVVFEGNLATVRFLTEHHAVLVQAERHEPPGTFIVWHIPGASPLTGPRIAVGPTGHLVVYGMEGRRILCADPDGTVLHECAWMWTETGVVKMARARVQLDCQQWLGIKPEATMATTTLDLSAKPGWQQLTTDDLRLMATRAWDLPLDNVRYFYPDECFARDDAGHVTIRLEKDGLYLLKDGAFEHRIFLSYMGAIPWTRIDILNVVELYQSTPPGTGGAVFELLWGLCNDQRQADGPIPLRYRGLPTFPSEEAYGLFCAFFKPEAPPGSDLIATFMDPQRASEIAWWSRPDPPWRYFDRARKLCVTVQGGIVQKVVMAEDPVAVPFINLGMRGYASCERTVRVSGGILQLRDGKHLNEVPVQTSWGPIRDTPHTDHSQPFPYGWRAFFGGGGPPKVDPFRAHTLVLCFPDDGSEVEEESTQLLVLEQIYAELNWLPDLPARVRRLRRVLIDGFDPVIAGLVDVDLDGRYTVLYRNPEWAQRSAQVVWDRAARAGRLEALRYMAFLPERDQRTWTYGAKYDLIYRWIPFMDYDDTSACGAALEAAARALASSGLLCVVGPPGVKSVLSAHGLHLRCGSGAEDLCRLPAMVEHLRIHPNTRVNPRLTVVLGEKGD